MSEHENKLREPLPGVTTIRAELPADELNSILVTFNRYAVSTDTGDQYTLAETFVEDGVFTVRYGDDGDPVMALEGRQEIGSSVAEARRQQGYLVRHFITNLTAQRTSALTTRAHAYFFVTRLDGSDIVNAHSGYYLAEFRKEEDSVWRIGRLDVHIDGPTH